DAVAEALANTNSNLAALREADEKQVSLVVTALIAALHGIIISELSETEASKFTRFRGDLENEPALAQFVAVTSYARDLLNQQLLLSVIWPPQPQLWPIPGRQEGPSASVPGEIMVDSARN